LSHSPEVNWIQSNFSGRDEGGPQLGLPGGVSLGSLKFESSFGLICALTLSTKRKQKMTYMQIIKIKIFCDLDQYLCIISTPVPKEQYYFLMRIFYKNQIVKTYIILPEDQISLNFDILRLSYKNQSCQNL
jgi:hypothetical protein